MGTIFLVYTVYKTYCTSKSGIWRAISRVAAYFHEPKASAMVYSILDILTIDILEIWIKKSVF